MAWIYLFLGGLFEIGWPLGFKLAHGSSGKILWITFSVLSMALSGLFLFMAQKTIPIGTAYVVWTGIGAVGTLLIGIFFFNDLPPRGGKPAGKVLGHGEISSVS